jgi:5-keto 4-deoxyuronate isomerase
VVVFVWVLRVKFIMERCFTPNETEVTYRHRERAGLEVEVV